MSSALDPDELVRLASAQPEVAISREVSIPGPGLLAKLHSPGGMMLNAYLADSDRHTAIKTFRYGHLLGPGLSSSEIDAWQASFPLHRIPADLRASLARFNGVHLWADLDAGRADVGIAPLSEWTDARHLHLRDDAQSSLALSYHSDGAYFLVLDTLSSEYRWLDHEDPDNHKLVGRTFAEVLGWLWNLAEGPTA